MIDWEEADQTRRCEIKYPISYAGLHSLSPKLMQRYLVSNDCIHGVRPTHPFSDAADRNRDRVPGLYDNRHLAVPKRGILVLKGEEHGRPD
jgi:hypothetical protein